MDFNEISMCMDVKLDIYDKRPDSLKFKTWTKCEVKIEAIKCLPCFLRISCNSVSQDDNEEEPAQLCVSINIPGVTISLATSRTKQHSYGLFWSQNRRNCFIYFALDTDMSCRKHMKWIKKSIKNLEFYRQMFLEQRRNSRGPTLFSLVDRKPDKLMDLSSVKDALSALGPLPQIPDVTNGINWSRRVSRASEIYEEILEESVSPNLSSRLSHISISSGIYEEMKPCSLNIHSIVEENLNSPPPLPPLPPHRRRVNTFDADPLASLGNILRSNTNLESDLEKKMIYKNVFENVLSTKRTRRSDTVMESHTLTMEERKNDEKVKLPINANGILEEPSFVRVNKRNSFSSPNLSKINFLNTFDEEKLTELLRRNSSSDLDAHVEANIESENTAPVNSRSSSSSNIGATPPRPSLPRIEVLQSQCGSMETLNISSQLPQNFNFSACNTSSVNLIGANGAVPSINKVNHQEIMSEDELSGYCIMAPIVSKKIKSQNTITSATSSTTSSTTSGYSTGSYYSSTCSSVSSSTQVTEYKDQQQDIFQHFQTTKKTIAEAINNYDKLPLRKNPLPVAEPNLSNIYENIHTSSYLNGVAAGNKENTPTSKDFDVNLYENLLTIKAAQELEQPLPPLICTSTPTDSPAEKQASNASEEHEIFCRTLRKSIISFDDKVPSYYPNTCDTFKTRRRSHSPSDEAALTTIKGTEKKKTFVNSIANIKTKRERNENLYKSSTQNIEEQRKKFAVQPGGLFAINVVKSKRSANAQKISENVYAVNLFKKKSQQLTNNNNGDKSPCKVVNETGHLKQKLHNELLQLALLQKIDFKFDDTSAANTCSNVATISTSNATNTPTPSGISKLEQAELEYEHCFQATKDATRLLHKYATLGQNQSVHAKPRLQHHLKDNQSSNQDIFASQLTKLESPARNGDTVDSTVAMGSKKFASLPKFKKIDFSPLKMKISNVLQRNQTQDI